MPQNRANRPMDVLRAGGWTKDNRLIVVEDPVETALAAAPEDACGYPCKGAARGKRQPAQRHP